MKKITLFVCALATTVASFATIKENSKAIARPFAPTIHFAQAELATDGVTPIAKGLNAAVVTDTTIAEYTTSFTFNCGTPKSGIGYVDEAQIITPYRNSLTFTNVFGLGSSWYLNDELVASDTSKYAMPIGDYGVFPLPVMKTPTMPTSDTTSLAFIDYQYGAYHTSKYAKYAFQNYVNVAPAYLTPLTKCAMYTEEKKDYKGRDTYGSDWTFVGAGEMGAYSYGTKLQNPWMGDTTDVRYMDTILVLIKNAGMMYIDHISLGVYTDGENGVKDIFPGQDDHVRLTLYPISSEGAIDWENPIASAKADSSNYVGVENASSWYGILNFHFLDLDPITGNYDTVPAIAEGNFVAVLDEYNDGTANFGIITDYYTNITGDTYFAYTDSVGALKLPSMWRYPAGLLLNFYAYLPSVANAPDSVAFAQDELTKKIALKTNTYAEDYEIDAPEWVTIEAETVYDASEDHAYVVNITITVEAGEEEREGEVRITDGFSGYEFGFVVKQAGTSQGIENVSFKNDNKLYNVLGQEVSEDYQGVVIRNGEKFIK